MELVVQLLINTGCEAMREHDTVAPNDTPITDASGQIVTLKLIVVNVIAATRRTPMLDDRGC